MGSLVPNEVLGQHGHTQIPLQRMMYVQVSSKVLFSDPVTVFGRHFVNTLSSTFTNVVNTDLFLHPGSDSPNKVWG